MVAFSSINAREIFYKFLRCLMGSTMPICARIVSFNFITAVEMFKIAYASSVRWDIRCQYSFRKQDRLVALSCITAYDIQLYSWPSISSN